MAHQFPQHQGVPIMTQPQVVRVQPEMARPGFAHHSQNRLGILQILCGMVVAIVAVVMIFFQSSLYFFGYGIWTGIFFLVAGALAVSSARSKNTCPIVGCLIMCIFCLMAASIVVVFGAIGLSMDSRSCRIYDYRDDEWCEERKTMKKVNIILQAINVLTGLFECIVALVQMIICSRALCCAPSQPGTVYYTAAPQQVQIQAQYAQNQQAYPQYQPQTYGQPYSPAQYPVPAYGQPSYPEHRGMDPYAAAAYQSPPQHGAPPVYPQLTQSLDIPGRPPPYNPCAHGPLVSAPPYGDASYADKH